uniref:Glucosylceramidase n=1 Tax=Panagrolaimus sp. JU765 TaxID=591449 RepID=A0AC34RJJ5_9BILA
MEKLGLILLFFSVAHGLNTCVQKTYPGADPRIVCVCNSTYCDEFPPLGTLSAGQAAIYQSSLSGKRFLRNNVQFTSSKVESKNKVISLTFDDSNKYQTIIGFGGAFTDATGINFNKLSKGAQDNLVEAYWGDKGISYTTGRVPVASCDFSTHEYSYCETDQDFNMTSWSLAPEDSKYKIPLIKAASSKSGGKLQLFSTPWSAPGWMKTDNDMTGKGQLKGDTGGEYYQAFALYYYKFFEAYHKEGIDFWGLTVLNEPFSNGNWQIMLMDWSMEQTFVKKNLGPILKANNITKNIKIMIYDDQRTGIQDYSDKLLADPEAAKYVDGIGVHWYQDDYSLPTALTDVHNAHPTKFILATEACTYAAAGMAGDWGRALQYSYDIITDLQVGLNWATGWTDWNLVLDEQGGPNWVHNYVDAPIIVSNTSDEFYKQPIYYAMGHFSKFLQPGAQHVDLIVENNDPKNYLEVVGFVTPQNQRVAIIDNRQKSATYTIALKDKASGKVAQFDMEPRSIVTVVWNKP